MGICPNCGEEAKGYLHPECEEDYLAYLRGEAAPQPDTAEEE